MPCTAMVEAGQPEMSHHGHHGDTIAVASVHASHAVDAGAQATNKCCDGGYCSQGGCISLLALPQTPLAVAGQPLRPKLAAASFSHLTGTHSTPYRPPALA